MFCSFFGRIENKKNCFWNYMTFYKYFGFETLAISFPRFTLVWYEMDIDCLVLLQVPKCFVRIQIFWASPKIWLHLVPLQKLLCRSKKFFTECKSSFCLAKNDCDWHNMQIDFGSKIWTGTKLFATCKRTRQISFQSSNYLLIVWFQGAAEWFEQEIWNLGFGPFLSLQENESWKPRNFETNGWRLWWALGWF